MSASQQNSGIRKGRQEVGLVPSSDRQETHVLAVSHGLWIGTTSCFAQADEDAPSRFSLPIERIGFRPSIAEAKVGSSRNRPAACRIRRCASRWRRASR